MEWRSVGGSFLNFYALLRWYLIGVDPVMIWFDSGMNWVWFDYERLTG